MEIENCSTKDTYTPTQNTAQKEKGKIEDMGQMSIEQWDSYMKAEAEKLNSKKFEELPSLKFAEGVVTEFEIDMTNSIKSYSSVDPTTKEEINKKIIPCLQNGSKVNWWLNVRNPTYKEFVTRIASGQRKFKVIRTGKEKSTRYVFLVA